MKKKIILILIMIVMAPINIVNAAIDSSDVPTLGHFEGLFTNIVRAFGALFVFSFFIATIYGGVKLLLSAGDPKAVQAAKGTITYAVLGLALFAISFTILVLIQTFTGINLTTFRIFNP